jgi:hypothetical protein
MTSCDTHSAQAASIASLLLLSPLCAFAIDLSWSSTSTHNTDADPPQGKPCKPQSSSVQRLKPQNKTCVFRFNLGKVDDKTMLYAQVYSRCH